MPRGDGKPAESQRPRIKRYEVDEKFATTKKLRRRLNGEIGKTGTWATLPVKYFDPPDNTRMHRPGSRK